MKKTFHVKKIVVIPFLVCIFFSISLIFIGRREKALAFKVIPERGDCTFEYDESQNKAELTIPSYSGQELYVTGEFDVGCITDVRRVLVEKFVASSLTTKINIADKLSNHPNYPVQIKVIREGADDCIWKHTPNTLGYNHWITLDSNEVQDCRVTLKNGIDPEWQIWNKIVKYEVLMGGTPSGTITIHDGTGFGKSGSRSIFFNFLPNRGYPIWVTEKTWCVDAETITYSFISKENCEDEEPPDGERGEQTPPTRVKCGKICSLEGDLRDECVACICLNGNPDSVAQNNRVWTELGCLSATSNGVILAVTRIFVGIITAVVILRFIQAGFMMNTDDPEKIKEAKAIVVSAITALVFGIMIPIILNFIGIDVLGIGKIIR